MRKLVYLSSARQDFIETFRHITRESGSRAVGRAFVSKLQAQCRKLASLPGALGRARPELRPDIRSFPYKGYIIFFRYVDERFEGVNVLKGHLDFERYFDEADFGEI